MPATATPKRSTTSRAKQASNKKAAAAATANGNGSAARRSKEDTFALAKQIKEARDGGQSWSDIKESLGVDPAQGQFLIKVASVRPKDRIKTDNDEQLAKVAKQLRGDGVSKAEIAARAGVSVGHVRKLLPDDVGRTSAAKPAAKAATPKAKSARPARSRAKAGDAANGAAPEKGEAEAKSAPKRTRTRRRTRAEAAQDPSPKG